MAYGDVGGAVTELIITCQSVGGGNIAISKGDAVSLVGDYIVDNATPRGERVFGQAMANVTENGACVPVKVRGIGIFEFDPTFDMPDINQGVVMGLELGAIAESEHGNGCILKVDTERKQVHVLM